MKRWPRWLVTNVNGHRNVQIVVKVTPLQRIEFGIWRDSNILHGSSALGPIETALIYLGNKKFRAGFLLTSRR